MDLRRTLEYRQITKAADGTLTVGHVQGVPDITAGGPGEPAAWFLGPSAENQELLGRLVARGLEAAGDFRRAYAGRFDDPPVISEEVKAGRTYREAVAHLEQAYDELVGFVSRHATPYASLRYQGHMLWDNTLPALAGYFATMLHNPNNVTIQASTATTPLALLVGWDLCRMVGFPERTPGDPWSHITADGSIANIEATWATREQRYMPFSLAFLLAAARPGDPLYPAREITVTSADGRVVELRGAGSWTLFNLPMDVTLGLPARAASLAGLNSPFDVWNALLPYTFDALGGETMWQRIVERDAELGLPQAERAAQPPVMFAPSTRHYSWPKAAAVCGYGMQRLWDVKVDARARQPIRGNGGLAEQLEYCRERRIPVAMAVAVIGSTEESAVDPLAGIVALREELRVRGLDFNIHADAAWGGYVVSAIRRDYAFQNDPVQAEADVDMPPYADEDPFIDDYSGVGLSDYVIEQYKSLREADSVTIDPHKMGYVQYPAGAILYRNGDIRRLTTFTGAYIGGIGSVKPGEPTVGIFGLEGSKPGAAAAAVYLSHRVIRPTVAGYGKIVNRSMLNAKRFFLRLMALNRDNDDYECVPLALLPHEAAGAERAEDYRHIAELARLSEQELLAADGSYFRALGADLNIVDYVFNPKHPDGRVNTSWESFQAFNKAFYDAFHVQFDPPMPLDEYPPMMVTMTTFAREEYGDAFIGSFAGRIGLEPTLPEAINCVRSTVMDPYVAATSDGDFFDVLLPLIDGKVREMVRAWRESGSR